MSVHLESLSTLTRSGETDLETAATAFEAYFLRRMLKEIRGSSGSSPLDGGTGGKMFREMLDEALADAMAEGGGVGIAKSLISELQPYAPRGRASSGSFQSAYGGSTPLTVAPVDAPHSSEFGTRTDPIDGSRRFHSGVDLTAPAGTPVRAAGSGVVTRASSAGDYGNLVVVDHGGGLETRYAHLAEITVSKGDRLEAGGELGAVGTTGRSTGPHLHLEVRRDGRAVDPKNELPALKTSQTRPNR